MRRTVTALALVLAACGSTPSTPNPDSSSSELEHATIQVQGRTIDCVIYDDAWSEQGGVSCDWSTNE